MPFPFLRLNRPCPSSPHRYPQSQEPHEDPSDGFQPLDLHPHSTSQTSVTLDSSADRTHPSSTLPSQDRVNILSTSPNAPQSPISLDEKEDLNNRVGDLPDHITMDPSYIEPGALYPSDHPLGWFFAVLPTFLATFVIFGYNYSFGIYQRYYRNGPYADQSTTQIMVIGSLGPGTLYLLGPIIGKIVERWGVRPPLILSALFCFLGLFLASFASQLWHLYLSQGLMYGIGGSFAFYSTISLSSQWFRRRRGLAGGFAYSGSGIGGIVYSEVAKALLNHSSTTGHIWTLRTVSFMSLGILLLSACLAKERFPTGHAYIPKSKGGKGSTLSSFLDLSLLRDPTFCILSIMGALCTFGFLGPFFLNPSYATFIGLSTADGATLSTILSAISGVGRIFLGLAADRFGKVNSLFVCTVVGGVVCMVYWPFAKSMSSLVGFVILYGLFGGGFIGLLPVVVAVFVRPERLAKAMGVIFCLQALGFYTGTLIAAAILDSTSPNTNYLPAMMYCGALTVAAGALVFWLKLRVNRSLWAIV
ncbi:MAG: major facilitator superfamily domain-containing protein [Piptocephalis tieghemiana]|nr:MAG: major facilitator superfamily domain-containing protein [Piptocephalis tieghemiana]